MSTINELLERYADGRCSEAEKQHVEDWLARHNNNNDDWLKKDETQQQNWLDSTFSDIDQIIDQGELHAPQQAKLYVDKDGSKLRRRLLIAASLLLAGSLAVWFFLFHQPQQARNNRKLANNEILPGRNAATLLLADGGMITLNEAKNGVQFTSTGVKYTDGTPVEHFALKNSMLTHATAILKTPVGGQYQLILADGTKIWLNAATSVGFIPDLTKSKERIVTVEGEAYLEVAKVYAPSEGVREPSKMLPFIVKSRGQEVTVLGTKFNINSYGNEPTVKTTLLAGSVKVQSTLTPAKNSNLGEMLILKPGEQSDLKEKQLTKHKIDAESAVDWKEGDFVLDDQDLQRIMRKVSRWYNVTVVYEGNVKPVSFLGTISRSKKLSSLLELLEANGKVHFKVNGRTVTVIQ